MSTVKLTVIQNATVDLLRNGQTERVSAFDISVLPAGTQFRVAAVATVFGWPYVVELGRYDREVRVLFPATEADAFASMEGSSLTLPNATGWLQAPVDGELRVVIADRPVAASEWATLIGDGRDGKGHTTHGSDAAVPNQDQGKAESQPTNQTKTAPRSEQHTAPKH